MCGLIGYIGDRETAPILFKGLQHLEYRGYDSAGVALIHDGKIWCRKDAGLLSQVEERHKLSSLPGNMGIGHVRWATHGEVNQINAHPLLDCRSEIAVVHNGVIENHRELRHRLSLKHRFISETDTEVVPHLIEEFMEQGFSLGEALRLATKEIKGYYALLAISVRESDKIAAACRDEPLVIGVGSDGSFVASDILAFLEETRKVIYLESDEAAVITRDGVSIFDGWGRKVVREPVEVEWGYEEATKCGYDHFMLKEIMEQPQAMRHALRQGRRQIMEMAMEILRKDQVVFTACGTSRYAALLGRYLFSRIGGKFSDVIMASEFQYFSDSLDRNTLVLAISQSGETADVLTGVRAALEQKATVFSIVNRVGSLLARISHRVVYLNCGPEIAVAATKSFISQLVVLYLLAFSMRDRFEEAVGKINELSFLLERSYDRNDERIKRLAEGLKECKNCYFIGRGANLHIAAEGALKLKEIAYIHAEGMPAGELKHGTLSLIEKGTPVVVICPQDHTFYDTLSNAAEAKARGAYIIGVSNRHEEIFDEWLQLVEVEEILYPLVSVIPLQLLAYWTAVAKGLNPDKPRNLAKSVTVK